MIIHLSWTLFFKTSHLSVVDWKTWPQCFATPPMKRQSSFQSLNLGWPWHIDQQNVVMTLCNSLRKLCSFFLHPLRRLPPTSKETSVCTQRDHVSTQQAAAAYKPREQDSEWNISCWHLDLGLCSLHNCEKC